MESHLSIRQKRCVLMTVLCLPAAVMTACDITHRGRGTHQSNWAYCLKTLSELMFVFVDQTVENTLQVILESKIGTYNNFGRDQKLIRLFETHDELFHQISIEINSINVSGFCANVRKLLDQSGEMPNK